jgi:Lactate dehydrogenase and related dehydrogenases
VVRNTSGYDKQTKSGLWDWKAGKPLLPMRNKTLGFMAFGKIPRTLIQITAGFDLEYIAYDPYLNPADVQDVPVEIVSWDELLTDSDYISIHAPLVNATRGKFNRAAFSKMQDNVILINTARGEIVDEDALDWALSKGEIFGAGIDVIEGEPRANSPCSTMRTLSYHRMWLGIQKGQ